MIEKTYFDNKNFLGEKRMKKVIGFIALFCVVVTLASCGLPDPNKTVEAYFNDMSKSDGYFARQIREDEDFKAFVEEYPATADAFEKYVVAYLGTFNYEIHKDRTIVDKQAGKAQVFVTYTCADISKITEEISNSSEYMDYIANMDFSRFEDLIIFLFEGITRKIESGNAPSVTVDATVELQYDSAMKAWVITNEDAIFSEIF